MSNNPVALYRNLLTLADTIPAGGELLTDNDTTARWFPADTDFLEYTGINSARVTHIGIAAHNLGTTAAGLLIEGFDGATWSTITTVTASDDQSRLVEVPQTLVTGLRVTADGAGINVGILYIGEAFVFERRLYQGHTPITLADSNTRTVKQPGGGQYLGNSVRRRARRNSIELRNLTPQFVRTKLEAFRQHYNAGGRFFLSWRPEKYPDEAAYCRGDGTLSPTNSGPRELMSIKFSVIAYEQTPRPDMVTP